jgi:hypothetical protein
MASETRSVEPADVSEHLEGVDEGARPTPPRERISRLASKPAAVEATWVPWPLTSSGSASGRGGIEAGGRGVVGGTGEVPAVDHLGGGEASVGDRRRIVGFVRLGGAGTAEGGVGVVDAGVDDGD